jgi:hypothetical protein
MDIDNRAWCRGQDNIVATDCTHRLKQLRHEIRVFNLCLDEVMMMMMTMVMMHTKWLVCGYGSSTSAWTRYECARQLGRRTFNRACFASSFRGGCPAGVASTWQGEMTSGSGVVRRFRRIVT